MSKKAVNLLKDCLKKNGPIKVALELGHKDTSRVIRWSKTNKIPETQENIIKYVLLDKMDKGDL